MQYALRVFLLFHSGFRRTTGAKSAPRPTWEIDMLHRVDSTISGFSLSRWVISLSFGGIRHLFSIENVSSFSTG